MYIDVRDEDGFEDEEWRLRSWCLGRSALGWMDGWVGRLGLGLWMGGGEKVGDDEGLANIGSRAMA